MIERHLTRLRARHAISEAEEQAIRGLVASTRVVPARTVVVRDSERLEHSTLLFDGLLCRFKDLPDGERQNTELHIPGDFADMHSFTLKRLDHSIMTLSESVIALTPHDRIQAMIEAHPRLGRIYWFGTNLDAAIHREWELSLGRRTAVARLAMLLCELHVRLGLVGLVSNDSFRLPVTQADLAECVGLTAVHVNRMLRQLREENLAQFAGGIVTLTNVGALRELAAFDPRYLYLEPDEL